MPELRDPGTGVHASVSDCLDAPRSLQRFQVRHVPARVDEETGEQFFSPSTVENLQQMILGHAAPSKWIETPVYEYLE